MRPLFVIRIALTILNVIIFCLSFECNSLDQHHGNKSHSFPKHYSKNQLFQCTANSILECSRVFVLASPAVCFGGQSCSPCGVCVGGLFSVKGYREQLRPRVIWDGVQLARSALCPRCPLTSAITTPPTHTHTVLYSTLGCCQDTTTKLGSEEIEKD